MTELSNLKWKRIVLGGVAPHAISVGLLAAAIVGYTVAVSLVTLGEPDQAALGRFNAVLSTQIFPAVTILLTVAAAAWTVRVVESRAVLVHGLAVGLLAAGLGLAFGAADLGMAVRFASATAAGVVGAKLEPVLFER